jgi:hypothetical protein
MLLVLLFVLSASSFALPLQTKPETPAIDGLTTNLEKFKQNRNIIGFLLLEVVLYV